MHYTSSSITVTTLEQWSETWQISTLGCKTFTTSTCCWWTAFRYVKLARVYVKSHVWILRIACSFCNATGPQMKSPPRIALPKCVGGSYITLIATLNPRTLANEVDMTCMPTMLCRMRKPSWVWIFLSRDGWRSVKRWMRCSISRLNR